MLDIQETNTTFQSVYEAPYCPRDEDLKEANLLLLPYSNYRGSVEYGFTEYAEEFLRYAIENSPDVVKADIAIDDDDYRIIQLHSLTLDIGKVIIEEAILPIVIGLITNYIYDRIKKWHKKPQEITMKVTIVSQDSGNKSTLISYEGSAEGFDKTIKAVGKLSDK